MALGSVGRSFVLAAAALALSVSACGGGNGPGPQGPTPGNGNGPLANLEASPFMNEVWFVEGAGQVPFIYFARENVRLNAQCRNPAGPLTCDAMRFMRNGMPVEIARRALDGRSSAGVKVCQRMNQPLVSIRNQMGAEDSMCRFPDGSLISTAALEQYMMRVIQ